MNVRHSLDAGGNGEAKEKGAVPYPADGQEQGTTIRIFRKEVVSRDFRKYVLYFL